MHRLLGLVLIVAGTTICAAFRLALISTSRLASIASAQPVTSWVAPRRTPRSTTTTAAHKSSSSSSSSAIDFLYPRPRPQPDAMDYAKAMTQVRERWGDVMCRGGIRVWGAARR